MEYKGSKFDMYQFVLFDNILSDRQSFLLSIQKELSRIQELREKPQGNDEMERKAVTFATAQGSKAGNYIALLFNQLRKI
jgi:hypothetical protein